MSLVYRYQKYIGRVFGAELEGLVGADKIEKYVSEFESSGMWYYPVSFVNNYFVDSESEGVKARSFKEFAL